MKKRPDHAYHLALAARVRALHAEATTIYVAIYVEVGNTFGTSHRATTKLRRMLDSLGDGKSALDDEYHRVTSQDQFGVAGHVYCGAPR